jgi:hypothetical protein
MRKRIFRWALRATMFVGLSLIGLWLISPIFAKSKAEEKAAALGLTMTVYSVNHSAGGFLFEKVHITSNDLPFEADFDKVQVVLRGSAILHPKVESVTITGGTVTITGKISEARDKWAAWKEKHHSSGSSEKIAIQATSLLVEWKSPCGGEDTSITNVSANNAAGLEAKADEATVSCLGWKGHATTIRVSSDGLQLTKLELTQLEAQASEPGTTAQRKCKQGLCISGHIPNTTIGEVDIQAKPYSAHAKNILFSGESKDGVAIDSSLSFDEMEADLPKIHKITLGKTEVVVALTDMLPDTDFLFAISIKSEQAKGKLHSVTGSRVSFGPSELFLHGAIRPNPTWVTPHVEINSPTRIRVRDTEVSLVAEWSHDFFRADVDLPATSCQKLIESVPDGMNMAIGGLGMNGDADMHLHVAKNDKDTEPAVKFHFSNRCKVIKPPDGADRTTLRSNFNRVVPGPMGEGVEIATGPSSTKWVPLERMSHYLVDAIQVTEDPNFFGHHGFDQGAVENSIKADIASDKFVRGASTVTMQLAKNLWLSREKTLARKIQEAFLTIYLEQTLSKNEILETYFNVVEFGPMVYGIHDAADQYFQTTPEELTLSQSLFLASLLPNPKQNWFASDGKLQPSRQKYLQTLMLAMQHRHLITQAQYDAGMLEVPIKGKPVPDGLALDWAP